MITKPFNQKVHDACDPPAREAVSKYIKATWGMNAWHNPDQYAVDLIIEKDKQLREYEKTIEEIQKFQVERKAAFLKGSNLDDTLYSKKL